MVTLRLCKTERLLSLCEPNTFSDCETEIETQRWLREKNRHCETYRTAQKTRLRHLCNSTKMLRNLCFLKDYSPPLKGTANLKMNHSQKHFSFMTGEQFWFNFYESKVLKMFRRTQTKEIKILGDKYLMI